MSWLGVSVEQNARESRAIISRFDPDWLVVDHYTLANEGEAAVKPVKSRLSVIDDLANRKHACDALLDQNLG